MNKILNKLSKFGYQNIYTDHFEVRDGDIFLFDNAFVDIIDLYLTIDSSAVEQDLQLTSKSEELINLGKKFDENFKPHLTLCRVKEMTRALKNFLDEYQDEYFGTSVIDAVSLFSSTLTKEGPIYKEIYKKELIE